MNKWADKYIIGLTGNIGTGKSVVRRMLEHLGAYGIDADALAHRALASDGPGFGPVTDTFGKFLLTPEGQIDREKLGRIVFNDPEALGRLESILHPLVEQAVDLIVRRATHKVIVVEAIKLLESELFDQCDAIWVVFSPPEMQLSRLVQNRKMNPQDAQRRIDSQVPQESRLAGASVVIKNISSIEETWKQVTAAWQRYVVPSGDGHQSVPLSPPVKLNLGEVNIQRAGPKQVEEIVETINRLNKNRTPVNRSEIMAEFGEKAFLLLKIGENPMGILGWQVENLVARTSDILLDSALAPVQYLPILIREMEKSSIDLQCEISIIYVPIHLSHHDVLWNRLGYEKRAPALLGVSAWQEAAEESIPEGTVLFFKQLRQDRVLRPI
ncbi:MAG: dephospho-CoA kinase [Chloroflexi bacterium]|nr:dephospho-CoA kinase [Chloroflexota bacterium]